MNKLIFAFLALALTCAVHAADKPLQLKGVYVGMTYKLFISRHPFQCHRPAALSDELRCGAFRSVPSTEIGLTRFDTLADVPIRGAFFLFRKSLLVSADITFDASKFDQMASVFLAKFGTPAHKGANVVQNKMGAKFDNERYEWNNAGAVMILQRRGGKVDTSTIKMYGPQMDQIIEENKKKALNDM